VIGLEHEYVVFPVDAQLSAVQLNPSEQFGTDPAWHEPLWQESLCVQPLESALHEAPFALLGLEHMPVEVLQVPAS